MADAYRVLNVSPTASNKEIRSNYVELSCQHHPCNSEGKRPNQGVNHTQFRLVAEAFFLIGDDLRRELYDLIKSSSNSYEPGHLYRQNLDGPDFQQARLNQPTRRSRAFSELTIDLRVGLPPELRALLIVLDPIKLFNRVVTQIDQERKQRAKSTDKSAISLRLSPDVTGVNPYTGSKVITTSSKSKFLSPYHCFLDEGNLQPSRSPPKSNATRQDAGSRQRQPSPNPNSKPPGILRDESKSQFRRPLSNLTESLKRDQSDNSYERIVNLEIHGEPITSRGHSRNTSYISSGVTGAGTSNSQRNNRSRRVSFSNDVIESDELKQAREVVKSFKFETARKSIKAVLANSSSIQNPQNAFNSSNRIVPINGYGLSTNPNTKNSPPSSYNKTTGTEKLFSDNSLYNEPSNKDRRVINSFPKESPPQHFVIENGNSNAYHRNHSEYKDGPVANKARFHSVTTCSAPSTYVSDERDEFSEMYKSRRNVQNNSIIDTLLSPSLLSHSSSFVDRNFLPTRAANRSPRRDGN